MIYVEILGRMGNQMFSYDFARKLQMELPRQRGEKIAFDFTRYGEGGKNELAEYICNENLVDKERKYNLLQKGALWLYFYMRNRVNVKDEVIII